MQTPGPLRMILVHIALLAVTLLTLFPVLWVVKMAVEPGQALQLTVNPFPTSFSLQNFRDVVSTTAADGTWLFGWQLLNSLVISGATALVGLCLACTAGYALSRWGFPGREEAMGLFLLTQMFPGVMMSVPLYMLLERAGLLDTMTGLILVYSTTSVPFATWNLKGYFDTIPKDLEEAAMMDGAGRWTTFTKIILPLARPALAVTGLFAFISAWNEFILAATMLGDERRYTLPIVLKGYVGEFSAEWGHFAAAAILVSVPVTVLFFILQRHLVEGLTAGSVKG